MAKSNEQNVKIKGNVKRFAEADYKRFKKKNKDYYNGKKNVKKAYYADLEDSLPDVIEWVLRYGHIKTDDVKATKINIFGKFLAKEEGEEFIEFLIKDIKDGVDIDNIKLLPILIKEMLSMVAEQNAARTAEGREDLVPVDHIVELAKRILKKKIKKAVEEGVSEDLAFDLLSVLPCDKAMEFSATYRTNNFMNVLYEHAKTETINFEKVMSVFIDKKYIKQIILFELLERKDRFTRLTDSQKELYLAISTWCFKTLNGMSKNDIKDVIEAYASMRKRDAEQQKDSNRRYALASLSVNEYENLAKMIGRIISENEGIRPYLQ